MESVPGGNTGIPVKNANCNTSESIDFNNTINTYASANSLDIEVSYQANEGRDIVVLLNSPDGTWLGNGVKTVAAGAGVTTVTTNLANAPVAALNYNLVITLRAKGGDWSTNISTKNRLVEITGVVTSLENNAIEELNVYPNPTSNFAQLSKTMAWEVYSSLGMKLLAGTGTEVDLSNLTNGIYLLRTTEKTITIIKK